jgi:hypothetical protein
MTIKWSDFPPHNSMLSLEEINLHPEASQFFGSQSELMFHDAPLRPLWGNFCLSLAACFDQEPHDGPKVK